MDISSKSSFQKTVFTALMIAIIFISGNLIKIPTVGGFVHLGDCMVLLSAVLLGKKRGAVASGFGMALVDLYGGYLIWAPFTFIIKALMAYITGYLIEVNHRRGYLVPFLVSGVFMVIAYFLSGAIIAFLFTGSSNTLIGALMYSAKDIFGNIIQVGVGIVIALPLSKVLYKEEKKSFN
ncbi:ECF transporter S component [Clostridium sp.]|uniref:ECF transporter S component n=1 Tax=Clostridium sp. TaxID=1506 RepID=UPI0026114CD8|nr:ECF transporter S component [Clostridium sp.]